MDTKPRRRSDDLNIVQYGIELYRGQTLSPFVRIISFALASGFAWFGYGPLLDADGRAWENPVFDGVFTVATPWMWGSVFWLCSALMLFVAISGRAIVYLVTLFPSTGTMVAWSTGVITQAIVSEEAHLTQAAVGLYIFTFTAIVGLAGAPKPFEMEVEIVERSADGKLIPIERLERRAG